MEFLPGYMDEAYFDGIHTVYDVDAFDRVKELAQKRRAACWKLFRCSVACGITGGANSEGRYQHRGYICR